MPSKHNPSDVKMYIQRLPVSALINRPSSGHVYTGLDNLRARSCPFYSFIKNYPTLNCIVLAYCGVAGRGGEQEVILKSQAKIQELKYDRQMLKLVSVWYYRVLIW
jgi:hypothetical protein